MTIWVQFWWFLVKFSENQHKTITKQHKSVIFWVFLSFSTMWGPKESVAWGVTCLLSWIWEEIPHVICHPLGEICDIWTGFGVFLINFGLFLVKMWQNQHKTIGKQHKSVIFWGLSVLFHNVETQRVRSVGCHGCVVLDLGKRSPRYLPSFCEDQERSEGLNLVWNAYTLIYVRI